MRPGGRRRTRGFVFDFDADAPLTFFADLCLRPATQDCDGPDDRLAISRLQVEDFSVELDSKNEEDPPTIVLDTDSKPVTGLFTLDKGPLELRAELSDIDGDGESGSTGNLDLPLVDAVFTATPMPDGLIADRVVITRGGVLKFTNRGGRLVCPEGFNAKINASFFVLRPIKVILFELVGTTTISANLTDELRAPNEDRRARGQPTRPGIPFAASGTGGPV